jgi:hypothetical protein
MNPASGQTPLRMSVREFVTALALMAVDGKRKAARRKRPSPGSSYRSLPADRRLRALRIIVRPTVRLIAEITPRFC